MSDWTEGLVESRGLPNLVATGNITKNNAELQLSEVLFGSKDVTSDHATWINPQDIRRKQKNKFTAHRKHRFLPHD